MVLVSVGQEDAADAVLILNQISEVGDDHVDAVHIVIGETHAHVDDDDVVAVLKDGQVFADLVQTAKGDNL